MPNVSFEQYVEIVYQGVLGRKPDPVGLQHHVARLAAGQSIRALIDGMLASDEYRSKTAPAPALDLPVHSIDRPITIVDVGAQKLASEDHVYAPLLQTGAPWKCIGFEPLEDKRRERLALESDPRLELINAFIGDGKSHLFNVLSDSGSSSLLELNADFCRAFEHIFEFQLVGASLEKTETLDSALKDVPWVDFLKLDIQGFEFNALSHAAETLKKTSVVHCECMFGPMYKKQGYFSDIDALLRSQGFEFIDFSYLARYRYVDVPRPSSVSERTLWGDAVFFRPLESGKNPLATRVAQALIAEVVYQKPGLAQTITRE
jgi:FkbM family methyltransferase